MATIKGDPVWCIERGEQCSSKIERLFAHTKQCPKLNATPTLVLSRPSCVTGWVWRKQPSLSVVIVNFVVVLN